MKEAFVATLLELARNHGDDSDDEEEGPGDSGGSEEGGDDDPLDKYEFWRVIKAQVDILRREMGSEASRGPQAAAAPEAFEGNNSKSEDMSLLFESLGLQDEATRQPRKAAPSFGVPDRGIEDLGGRAGFPGYFPALSPVPYVASPACSASLKWSTSEM
jgi:hypothetical protein